MSQYAKICLWVGAFIIAVSGVMYLRQLEVTRIQYEQAHASEIAAMREKLDEYTFDNEEQRKQIERAMIKASFASDLPLELVMAVTEQESGYQPYIVSSQGAIGLMQVMPRTGQWFCDLTVDDLFSASSNAICGASYLSMLLEKFDGNLHLALAAYNAGPSYVSAIAHSHGVTSDDPEAFGKIYFALVPETRLYVRNITAKVPSV